MNYLQTPIEYLKGVGPQRAELIKKELEIYTFDDLLHYYPFRYADRSKIHTIKEINPFTQFIQLRGVVKGFKMEGAGRVKRLKAAFADSTGTIELVWFQGAEWMMKNIKINVEYVIFGKPNIFNNSYSIPHPEMDLATEQKLENTVGLMPLYSTTEKARKKYLDSKSIQKLTRQMHDSE